MLQRPQRALSDLAQVVRRNLGGHTNGDTLRAVDQQVRETCGQHGGLLGLSIVVVHEVDRVFFNIAHHLQCEWRHLGLGVTRGRGTVITGRTEVPLTERQRVAHRPVLHQAHERVVNRRVTVRVILTHHITDNTGTLRERLVGAVTAVVHAVDHTTVHRLETVTNLGQGATNDDAHRVVKVRTLHLQLQVNAYNMTARIRIHDGLVGLSRGVLFVSH